jgi:hypothetical protein
MEPEMPTTIERLMEAASALPESRQAEVLDFAEFLQARRRKDSTNDNQARLIDLCGGLESSTTFAGSPLNIQQSLRDEWP